MGPGQVQILNGCGSTGLPFQSLGQNISVASLANDVWSFCFSARIKERSVASSFFALPLPLRFCTVTHLDMIPAAGSGFEDGHRLLSIPSFASQIVDCVCSLPVHPSALVPDSLSLSLSATGASHRHAGRGSSDTAQGHQPPSLLVAAAGETGTWLC
ncbi:hypothetical protein BKA80DRAFT_76420 [Phyllosticta citrichinensis]